MAQESVDSLVTAATSEIDSMGKNSAGYPVAPVINESDCLNMGNMSANYRASIGSEHTKDNAKPDSAKLRRVVPNYLRASTGSCHDICKYGRRHAFEETARETLRKRIAKRLLNESNPVEVVVSDTQKKEKVVGHKLSVDTKKRWSLAKPSPDTTSYSPKFRTSVDAKASSSDKIRLSDSPTKKSASLYPPEIIKREIVLPSKKDEVPGKDGNSVDTKISRMSVKHSSSLKLKSVKVEPLSASDNSDGVHGKVGRNSGVSTVRKMTASASAKKVLVPPAAPFSPRFSLAKTASGKAMKDGRLLLSRLKNQSRIHELGSEDSSEKTLRVIKIGTGNDALESVPDDCAVPALPSPSLPNSSSHAKSNEGDDKEIKCCGDEADVFVCDNIVSTEIVEVQPANKNHNKIPRTRTETSGLESIPNDRSSPKSLSREEDEYNGNEADECVSDNTASVEIQPVKEKRNKIPMIRTEKNRLESIPDDNAGLPSSSSSYSSSHASSSSLFSHEEDDEQIMHTGSESDEIISESSVPMAIAKVQPTKQNHNKTLRKSRSVLSDDKHRSPVKLKFRSGKVLDLKPENNTPRRLKFWRTRVVSNRTDDFESHRKKPIDIGSPRSVKDNQNKPSRRSRALISEDKYRSPIRLFRTEKLINPQWDNNSLRKLRFGRARQHAAEDNKSDSRTRIFKRTRDKNNAAGAELSSSKVILKHQDLQGKKDAQGLFNNVIEETASKLVESQKSKVKALVGAFETVISLQERKPSLRSVS